MTHDSIITEFPRIVSKQWSSTLKDLTSQYRAWVRRREVYNNTFRELAQCSDRDLTDISIARCDIPRIAAEAARMARSEYLR